VSRSDLTRWNRAGLRRTRYVDADAATLLEELRLRLAERFPTWQGLQRDVPAGETPEARERRILDQYAAPRSPRPDWGWEIARAFARAAHVLVGHVDAYANEGHLGTATQWTSVRRLGAMLDYHPAPPASASTTLALVAKPGARGLVARGLAVKHSPPSGSPPVVFETLEDLSVDAALNELRPLDWDRSLEPVTGAWLDLDARVVGLSVGDPLVVEDERDASLHAHRIEEVVQGLAATQIRVSPLLDQDDLVRGHVRVHLKPKDRLSPRGPTQAEGTIGRTLPLTSPPAGLAAGEEVSVRDGRRRVYRRVARVAGKRLVLDAAVGAIRFGGASAARAVTLEGARLTRVQPGTGGARDVVSLVLPGNWSRLAGDVVADARGFEGTLPLELEVRAAEYVPLGGSEAPFPAGDGGATRVDLSPVDATKRVPADLTAPPRLLVPAVGADPWIVDAPLASVDPVSRLPPKLLTSAPRDTAAGDLVVVLDHKQLAWGRLASVVVDEAAGEALLLPLFTWLGRSGTHEWLVASTVVFARFAERARLDGWRSNRTPIAGTQVPLALPVDASGALLVPDGLVPGRKLIVEPRGGDPDLAFLTAVAAIEGNVLSLRQPIPEGAGFTRGNLVISGNAVAAGHGEGKPEKILGSGDATASGQSFALPVRDVSFVADPSRPSGVRADVEVRVDGRRWTQVADFRDSGPTDAVYVVRVVEDGSLSIGFGDGQHGRRLPTGRGNVRLRHRVGVGLAGNLPPGALAELARPHPLVAGVRQPLGAGGGNDMEGVESLRGTAPAALLTLQRCVSADDFAALASTHASVWQARAFLRRAASSRHPLVEVVVVPAEGKPLGPLADDIAAFLRAHALPGIDVTVTRFERDEVRLAVDLEIDTAAWDPEVVVRDVRAALDDALSLRRRKLGAPLYLSEVYRVVGGVRGVGSAVCRFLLPPDDPRAGGDDRLLRRVVPLSDVHVLYVDPDDRAALAISWRREAP
jgi:hypothetical protein